MNHHRLRDVSESHGYDILISRKKNLSTRRPFTYLDRARDRRM